MVSRDDDRFRVRPGTPKGRAGEGAGQRSQRFVSQVLKQVSKAGANASGNRGVRPVSTFGRGRVAAGRAGQTLAVTARRVVIKSRYVVLKKAGAKSVSTHLRYIERDGVTRDGEKGQAYGPETDAADLKAFEERGKGDRHQFRFIVSVEDAGELEDLRGYTREFMQRMTTDLETRLDWVAVDHWDTDNPHTHIVLRGRAGEGRGKGPDLVIAPDYMAHGMRMRASELATEWLGPRTELEIRQGLLREVEQERLTSLDRALIKHAVIHIVDLAAQPIGQQRQTLLRARLQRLEAFSLSERIDANRWHLSPQIASTLTALSERGDILRRMHKALRGEAREYSFGTKPSMPVVGRIAGKGLDDELHDRAYLVVDGIDGRAHYLKLSLNANLSSLPIGGIVEARSVDQVRAVDRNISHLSKSGIYSAPDHLLRLQQTGDHDPQASVDVHVRRLKALRRAGVVRRLSDGVWQVPDDLLNKIRVHDAESVTSLNIELKSHLPIDLQVCSIGATWLDLQLVRDTSNLVPVYPSPSTRGFGAEVAQAIQGRADFLVSEGLAQRQGQRIVPCHNLLNTLRDQDLMVAGRALEVETGLSFRPIQSGDRVSGIYHRALDLVSGRFAMLGDGMGFCLVPWRPLIEKRVGQHLSVVIRGATVSWQLGPGR